jgi:hypothetical protein
LLLAGIPCRPFCLQRIRNALVGGDQWISGSESDDESVGARSNFSPEPFARLRIWFPVELEI